MQQEDINAILAMDNLILRNLMVTQGYYQLSEGMKKAIGEINASWCTFATYASKTAGRSIRHEILPEDLERTFRSMRWYGRLERFMRRFLTDAAAREEEPDFLIKQVLARISLTISVGNIMVFAELSPAYSRMINELGNDATFDKEKLASFLTQFKPGPAEAGGQDACIEAFAAYYVAKFEADSKRKAELIYLSNILIGWHEQTRLQSAIDEAIHAPVDKVMGQPLPLYITPLGKRINKWVHRAFLGISRRVFSNVATKMFMSIYLPSGPLKLGVDVASPMAGQEFPPELMEIQLERVEEILKKLDRSHNSLFASRARNWSDLDDRMNFIVDFFRSYQQSRDLFSPPFTADQVAALDEGQVPEGAL